jgi:hypothetical protein
VAGELWFVLRNCLGFEVPPPLQAAIIPKTNNAANRRVITHPIAFQSAFLG